MPDVKEVYEMVTQQTPPKPDALERQRKRQMRHTMNRKLGGFAVAAAIAGLALLAVLVSVGDPDNQAPTSTGTGPSVTVPGVPKVDYVIDLNTGVMKPLPEAIIGSLGSLGKMDRARCLLQAREPCLPQYAASPDGSLLAYVGTGDEGSPQIFIAGIDGTGVRQVTHDPRGAASPAWSPDGTRIAYAGYGSGDIRVLFVLDVATGKSTQITEGTNLIGLELQFTPDGSSLLYTGGSNTQPVLRTVPVAGGKSTLLIGPRGDLADAGNGSLSPDGSLVTFLGSKIVGPGPRRWVANADGTDRRLLPPPCFSNPAGTWSPVGSRIVCWDGNGIIVIDIATGVASPVAKGSGAIWLNGHTLLVEV
jgi:Tol biopolymer transport system component